jgi:hypothetical protein
MPGSPEKMFSPIRASEIEVESCNAHLIPDGLGTSNATVLSERDFDNAFGALNDSRLIKHIRNSVEQEKEVAVEVYDEKTMQMLHSSFIRTKTTLEFADNGARKGNIILGNLPENLKSRLGLGIGSLLKIIPYSPTQEDYCRIGLSMLHSAYLTMYYHFGLDYVRNDNAESVRRTLIESVSDSLPAEAALTGIRHLLVTPRFIEAFKADNFVRLSSELLAENKHPVTIWSWQGFACFGVFLPYHQQYTAICLLPGFGQIGAAGFETIMDLIGKSKPIPVQGTRIWPWRPSSGESSSEFWWKAVVEGGTKAEDLT